MKQCQHSRILVRGGYDRGWDQGSGWGRAVGGDRRRAAVNHTQPRGLGFRTRSSGLSDSGRRTRPHPRPDFCAHEVMLRIVTEQLGRLYTVHAYVCMSQVNADAHLRSPPSRNGHALRKLNSLPLHRQDLSSTRTENSHPLSLLCVNSAFIAAVTDLEVQYDSGNASLPSSKCLPTASTKT